MGLEQLVESGISEVKSTGGLDLGQEQITKSLRTAVESQEVKNLYLKDINSAFGRAMDMVLNAGGYEQRLPDHYTYLDLPEQVMAATIKANDGRVILAYNSKHAKTLKSNPLLRLYVNLHEHAHVRGEHSESYTEGLVKDAARHLCDRLAPLYNKLGSAVREMYHAALAIANTASLREAMQYGK